MIIRRKMPRVSQHRTLGSSGRRALSAGTKLARRMTISRLPDPSAMSSDLAPDTAPQMPAQMPSLFEPLGSSMMAQRGRGNVSDVSTSPTMPKDLQTIYDRHATEDMRANAGMTSSGFIKSIIQRNKDAQAEQQKGRFTTPRPENVRFEPQKVQREIDSDPAPATATAENDVDFPEQPLFETRRTRSLFEYINVNSPDKVQAHRAEVPVEAEIDAEDFPDALPGSYSLDDYDQPTESFDVSSLYSEATDSPKAEAPQPTTVQRTPHTPDVATPQDLAEPSLEGLSTSYANTIQHDTSSEISGWSNVEDDMQFPVFEYPSQTSDEDNWQANSSEMPQSGSNDTVATNAPKTAPIQRRAADTISSPTPDVPDAADTSVPQQLSDSGDRGTTNVQRRLEQPSEVGGPSNTVQRTPSSTVQNTRHEVDIEIEGWQSARTAFEGEPFTYPPSSTALNTENDGDIIDTAESRPTRTSQPGASNVQREPAGHDTEGTSLGDPTLHSQSSSSSATNPMESQSPAKSSPIIQRTPEPTNTPIPLDSIPSRHNASSPSQIQRDVEDEIGQWQTDTPNFDGEGFFYEPISPTSTDSSDSPAIQRSPDLASTPTPLDNIPSRRDVTTAPQIQRNVEDEIGQWQADTPDFDGEGFFYEPISATSTDSSDSPAIHRSPDLASTPTPLDNIPSRRDVTTAPQIQRDVEDEIGQWQADTPDFDGEGFFYEPISATSGDTPPKPSVVQRSSHLDSWADNSNWPDDQADVTGRSVGTVENRSGQVSSGGDTSVETNSRPSSVQHSTGQPKTSSTPTVQRATRNDDSADFADLNFADPSDSVEIQRVAGPTDPHLLQSSVDNEVGTWQAQSAGFDAEPLLYHAPSTYEILGDSNSDTPSSASSPMVSGSSHVQRTTSTETAKPVIRRVSDPEAVLQSPSVGVTRVSHPATNQQSADRQSADSTASHIQRDVADEISVWQQNGTSAPPFAGESPDWDYASTGKEPTVLGPVTVGIQRVSDPSAVVDGTSVSHQSSEIDAELAEFVYTSHADAPSVSAQRDEVPLAQALAEAGFFTQPPSATSSTPSVQRTPQLGGNSSLYSELLDLMKMPTDTPVTDGPSVTVAANPAPIQRSPGPTAIQREEDANVSGDDSSGELSGHDNSGKEAASEGKSPDQQIDEMAEKVYSILNRRFRIEFQRKHGR